MYPTCETVAKFVSKKESQDAKTDPIPHELIASPVVILAVESSGIFAARIVPIQAKATKL
jgi:hypothetical protein